MKILLLNIFLLLSVNAEVYTVSSKVGELSLYKNESVKQLIGTTEDLSVHNIRLISEGEEFSKVSFYHSKKKQTIIAYVKSSDVDKTLIDDQIRTKKSQKFTFDKMILEGLKESFVITNREEFQSFLTGLPARFSTEALELDKLDSNLALGQKNLEKLQGEISQLEVSNSKAKNSLDLKTDTIAKLPAKNKKLAEENRQDLAELDKLKAGVVVATEKKAKDSKEAHDKRYLWAGVAALLAFVLAAKLS